MPDMNSKYVERVLSHIGQGTERAELKYELESHIDEKLSYFQSLGYDEETALEKAEEVMGDPDVAGEQLYLQIKGEKRKNALYVLLAVATALLNLLYYVLPVDPLFDGSIFDIYFSEFWIFVISAFAFAFTLFNIIIGFKKKKALNLVSALLFGWLSNWSFSYYFATAIYYTNERVNYADIFIYRPSVTNFYDTIVECTIIISIIVMSLINVAGLVIIRKTKSLNNTKTDLVFSKTTTVLLSLWIVVCILFTVITSFKVYSRYKFVPEDFKNYAIQYETTFLDNIDRFITTDENEIKRTVEDVFPEGSYRYYYGNTPSYFGGYMIIYVDCTDDVTYVSFDCNVNNPFSIFYSTSSTENRYVLTKSDIRQDMTIKEAPMPADVSFTYDKEQNLCELIFEYAGEEYTFLQFTYDFETQSFNLTDSHARN